MHKLIISTLVLMGFVFNSQAQFGGPSAVKVKPVQELMMAPVRKVPAMVEAKFIATIKTESKGIVQTLAEVGATVKKGDTLAVLQDSQVGLRQEELNGAINSSQAKLTFLQSENTRLNGLVAKKLISTSELEKNKSEFISAKYDLTQAKSRLKQYLDLVGKLTIQAPYDGIVLQQLSQPGQLLNSGDNVIEFMQSNNLEVVVNVPFKYKSQITTNAEWKVETSDKQIIAAHIKSFIPAATGQSHTIQVRLHLQSDELWSGEAVNVWVPTQSKQKVIAVPRDALIIRKNGVYVYTVVDNKSHKVDVVTGIAQGDLIQVKGLISSQDQVIVRGNERLRNDQEVKIID